MLDSTNLTLNGPQIRIPARDKSLITSPVVFSEILNLVCLIIKNYYFVFILDPRKQLLLGNVIRKVLRTAIETDVNSRTRIFREVNATKTRFLSFQHMLN